MAYYRVQTDTYQGIRQEHVAGTAVLGDLGAQTDPVLGPAFRGIDIPNVQSYDLG